MINYKLFLSFDSNTLRQYLITFFFSILGALVNFYFFRQVYINIGEESFYYYSFARRVISFLSPVLLLGIGISLPRAIGHYSKDENKIGHFFMISLFVLTLAALIWFLLNIICNQWFTQLIWGENTVITKHLNIALSIYLISLNVAACIHSYYRGKINAMMAGVIDILVQSVLPLSAFLLLNNLISIFYMISILVGILNIVLIIVIVKSHKLYWDRWPSLVNEIKEFLGYGLRRVPGDIFYAMLIFLPAYFAGKYYNMKLAGLYSFGLSLLFLFNLPATAVSFVTLSRSASLLIKSKSTLRREMRYLLILGLGYSILALLLLYLFLGDFLSIFFDQEFMKYTQILFQMLWALPGLVIFTILRSLIDSAYIRPYNAYFIFIALIIMLVFAIFGVQMANPIMLILGNITAYIVLAALSLFLSFKILKI